MIYFIMNKSKKYRIIIIACILLVLSFGGLVLHNGVTYKCNIDIGDMETAGLQIPKEQLEIVNQYCIKSNKNSSDLFIFYKELSVLELNAKKDFDTEHFMNSNSLQPCADASEIKQTVSALSDKNNDWMKSIVSDNTNWYETDCQFEDTHIKSSVKLYFVGTNSSTIYLILDQRNI